MGNGCPFLYIPCHGFVRHYNILVLKYLFHDGGYSSMGATIPMIKLAHVVLNDKELADRVGLDEFTPSK